MLLIDTVLWDLDGTLLNTLEDLTAAVNYTMDYFGLPTRTLAQVRRYVGSGTRVLFERAFAENETHPTVDAAMEIYLPYYDANCNNRTRPYDGVPEMLDKLAAAGVKMAIVTNKPDSAAKILAQRYFGGLPAMGDLPGQPKKPDPALCLRAMEELGSLPERTVYVGDSEVDVATARNAGLPCKTVTWGFRDHDELVEAGATDLFDHAGALCAHLLELVKK